MQSSISQSDNFFTQQPNGCLKIYPWFVYCKCIYGDGCIGTTNITINNPAPIQISTTTMQVLQIQVLW